MKAARIALRTAVPLAGAGGVRSSRLPREVEQFSRFSPSPLSIKQLLDFGESLGESDQPEARAGGGVGGARGELRVTRGCPPSAVLARRRGGGLRCDCLRVLMGCGRQ